MPEGGEPGLGQLVATGLGMMPVLDLVDLTGGKGEGSDGSWDQGRWGLESVIGSGVHRMGPGKDRKSGSDQEDAGIN